MNDIDYSPLQGVALRNRGKGRREDRIVAYLAAASPIAFLVIFAVAVPQEAQNLLLVGSIPMALIACMAYKFVLRDNAEAEKYDEVGDKIASFAAVNHFKYDLEQEKFPILTNAFIKIGTYSRLENVVSGAYRDLGFWFADYQWYRHADEPFADEYCSTLLYVAMNVDEATTAELIKNSKLYCEVAKGGYLFSAEEQLDKNADNIKMLFECLDLCISRKNAIGG